MDFKLRINTDNAAFDDTDAGDMATEIGRILRNVADQVEAGSYTDQINVRDSNGNKVGECEASE